MAGNIDNLDNLKRKKVSEQNLKVYQLNCNSLSNKLGEIKLYIYKNKPEIVCLCETMIKTREPQFVGYDTFWKHRVGDKGGLAILCRKDLTVREIIFNSSPNGNLELQIIEVASPMGNIRIANIYNPHKNITLVELKHYLDILGSNKIMIGDLNAHSPIWDTRGRSNCTGRNLELLIENYYMSILNDVDFPTYVDNHNGSTSCLDLCLVSQNLANKACFKRGQDLGSDHFPIEVTIAVTVHKSSMESKF